jgi:hypothetical protein
MFVNLIRGGTSFEELVRSACSSKKQYIKFIPELNRVEQEFNAILQPHLDLDNSEVNEIVSKIENTTAALMRKQAKEIFG